MSYHPHGTPSFRNLIVRPMWITMKTALRTVPFLGKLKILKNDYHGQPADMLDPETRRRVGEEHSSAYQKFSADRETSPIMPFVERPVTVMYPYERLEDLEPWNFDIVFRDPASGATFVRFEPRPRVSPPETGRGDTGTRPSGVRARS